MVLTEEPSARVVINELCRMRNISSRVQVLEHEGKNDLEKSITRKINGWRATQPAHFIVTRDLNGASRDQLKTRLLSLVPEHSKMRTKIRIVIPELEAWYLGDSAALVAAGFISQLTANRLDKSARFRNLCVLQNAKAEFQKLVGRIGQIHAANSIAPLLDPSRNRSKNFHAFISALAWADESVLLAAADR